MLTIWCGVAAACLALPAVAQEVRQLPPHVHGQSHLSIAVEGKNLAMELHAPGNDIVGFEYAPSTDAQRAAVAAATNTLRDPIGLFGIPAAAQCTLGKAEITLAEEDEDEHAAAAPGATAAPAPPASVAAPTAKHSEFQVAYALTCNDVAAIASLSFAFFAKFPNALEVHVDLLTGKGAFSLDVQRANPNVSTRNMF
jgi:hypothetical protein